MLKDLDKFVFVDTLVDEGQVRELATGAFLDTKRKVIFIGRRRHWQNPSVHWRGLCGIRARARGHFFNLVDLVNQLKQEKAGQSDLA